ncbi:MAG: hypothetical protein Q9162_006068 [Coniocarpon cinnabarinum]
MGAKFRLVRAQIQDAADIASCAVDAFDCSDHPQTAFFQRCWPDTDKTRAFFERSFAEQMRREPSTEFIKIIDSNANDALVGFSRWTPPRVWEGHWEDWTDEMDKEMLKVLFSMMGEARHRLMGDRPHWFLEFLAVRTTYARQGVGAMMVEYGCNLADRDGVEAYVDASPAGKPLYERFGFESKATQAMPAPCDFYIESHLVRPKKV